MPVISVWKDADAIKSGKKKQVIIPASKRMVWELFRGKKLYIYSKYRSGERELLAEVDVKEMFLIRMCRKFYLHQLAGNTYTQAWQWWFEVSKNGKWVKADVDEIDDIAAREMLSGPAELATWLIDMYGEAVFDMKFLVLRW